MDQIITIEEEFWYNVDLGTRDDCWIWLGDYAFPDGRGIAYSEISGYKTSAPRVAWEYTFGPIPKGKFVCHDCPGGDNPRCCNPNHLWLGTCKENFEDARSKGRMWNGKQIRRIKEFMKGKESPNKGKCISGEIREKISLRMMGNKYTLGCKRSEETRKKLSEARKGKVPWNKGIPNTEETRKKINNTLKGKSNPKLLGNKIWMGRRHSLSSKLKMIVAKRRQYAYMRNVAGRVPRIAPVRTPIIGMEAIP